MERLVKNQALERVAAGMYVRPEIDPYIGKVPPNIEAIAEAIAKRDGARIGFYGCVCTQPIRAFYTSTHEHYLLNRWLSSQSKH